MQPPPSLWNADSEGPWKANPDLDQAWKLIDILLVTFNYLDTGYCPHPVTVHISGLIKGYIYI